MYIDIVELAENRLNELKYKEEEVLYKVNAIEMRIDSHYTSLDRFYNFDRPYLRHMLEKQHKALFDLDEAQNEISLIEEFLGQG